MAVRALNRVSKSRFLPLFMFFIPLSRLLQTCHPNAAPLSEFCVCMTAEVLLDCVWETLATQSEVVFPQETRFSRVRGGVSSTNRY